MRVRVRRAHAREVETPLPSNSPHDHMILRVDLVDITREVERPLPFLPNQSPAPGSPGRRRVRGYHRPTATDSDAMGAQVPMMLPFVTLVLLLLSTTAKAVQTDACPTALLLHLSALLTQHLQHQPHAAMPPPPLAQPPLLLPPQPQHPHSPQNLDAHQVRLCRVTHAPSRAPKAVNKIANQ